MSQDKKDAFEYDNLFVTNKKKGTSSAEEEGFVPMGSGRKSQYALSINPIQNETVSDTPKPERKQEPKKKTPTKKKKAVPNNDSKKPAAKKKPPKKPEPEKKAKKPAGAAVSQSVVRQPSSAKPKKNPLNHTAASKKKKKKNRNVSKKQKKNSKKRSVREDFLEYAYLGAMVAGGGMKKLFGRRRNRILIGVLLAIVILFGCYTGMVHLYKSNTFLTGNTDAVDDTAARTKELTDAQTRDKVTYFLIVGVDKEKHLTDCIWMLCFDNKAHKMNVLQIPRDTYVGSYSISPHKANAIFESKVNANWCETCDRAVTDDKIVSGTHTVCGQSISTKQIKGMSSLFYFVNNELHLPVDYYIKFDFEGFEKVIDALGGIDIVLDKEMDVYYTKSKHITLPAGHNHLDGAKALKFMRNRKIYANGDLGRVKAQRQIIHAILDKVQKLSILQTFNIVLAANGCFSTDMSPENIKSFIAPLKKCKSDDLHMFELPGEAKTVRRSSYYLCDEEKTLELLNEYMLPYSDKLNSGDIDFPEP